MIRSIIWAIYDTTILDYLVTCMMNGILFLVVFMKEEDYNRYSFVLDSLLLLGLKTLAYPLENYIGFNWVFSVFTPANYIGLQWSLDIHYFFTGGIIKNDTRWKILKLLLFFFSFRGLPGFIFFLGYMLYSLSWRYLFPRLNVPVKERLFIGTWLLIPVPLFHYLVIVPLAVTGWFLLARKQSIHQQQDNEGTEDEDEEEQKQDRSRKKFKIWKKEQKVNEAEILTEANTDKSTVHPNNNKEGTPFNYEKEKKKVSFIPLSV